jgi:hypothetical protein
MPRNANTSTIFIIAVKLLRFAWAASRFPDRAGRDRRPVLRC